MAAPPAGVRSSLFRDVRGGIVSEFSEVGSTGGGGVSFTICPTRDANRVRKKNAEIDSFEAQWMCESTTVPSARGRCDVVLKPISPIFHVAKKRRDISKVFPGRENQFPALVGGFLLFVDESRRQQRRQRHRPKIASNVAIIAAVRDRRYRKILRLLSIFEIFSKIIEI